MRYKLYSRHGNEQVLVNLGNDLAPLAVQAESYHAKNACVSTWVFDAQKQRIAEEKVGDNTRVCRWETHTTAQGSDRWPPDKPFQASSFNNRTGRYYRTDHASEFHALRRLRGNPRHGDRKVIDRTERFENGYLMPYRVLALREG